jgi:O-antigen/teichoic acid export membrane protein
MTININFKFFKQIKSYRLLSSGFLMSSFGILGGLLGYVFQILMGRLLTPKDFALFGALMGISAFVLSPLGALVMIVSKKVSIFIVNNQLIELLIYYNKINILSLKIVLFSLIMVSLFFNEFQNFFKLTEILPFIFFVSLIFFAVLQAINNAFLQGKKLFYLLGGIGLFGVIIKILISAILIVIGMDLNGVFVGVIVSMFIVWFLSGRFIIDRAPLVKLQLPDIKNQGLNFKIILPVMLANVAFVMMTQLDVVLVNYYFDSDLAGEYAAASVLGKAVLYLPGGLVTVLYPMVVEQHAMSKASSHLLFQAVSATMFACSLAALIYWFFGPALVNFFYGGKYILAGKYLSLYGFAILPMALVMVAEHFLIAKGRVLFAWIFLIIAPLQLLAINFYHQDIESVIYIIAAGGVFMCIIGYGMLLSNYLRNRIVV